MKALKIRLLRWLGLIEPCSLIGDDNQSHDRRLEPGDGCLLCYGRRWTPTRLMLQAIFQAGSKNVQKVIHPYDLWDMGQQAIDAALGDWREA